MPRCGFDYDLYEHAMHSYIECNIEFDPCGDFVDSPDHNNDMPLVRDQPLLDSLDEYGHHRQHRLFDALVPRCV